MTSPITRAFLRTLGVEAQPRAPSSTPQPRVVPLVEGLLWRSSFPEVELRVQEDVTRGTMRSVTQHAAQARGQAREDLYDEARRQQAEVRRLRVLIAASQGRPGLAALDSLLGKPQTVRGKE